MKETDQITKIQLDEQMQEFFPEYEGIVSRLGEEVQVIPFDVSLGVAFSVVFVQIFLRDTPNYELTGGSFGGSRSNWTYHTAMAMSQTCKILNLTCKFETGGKRDAIIETRNEVPETALVAEWEWDYEDVFGKGKELEKLKSSCKAFKSSDAFLLTYCPARKYLDYFQRIAEYWIKTMKSLKSPPSLFLHTVVFQDKSGCREFDRLRTVEISPLDIYVWNEQYF